MNEIVAGDRHYRIQTTERDGQWVARAEDARSGDRFGAEYVAADEREAIARVRRWLEWQAEHSAALEDLQTAERAYHRMIAGSAFTSPTEGPTAIELQKETLDQVEAARLRLDDIRSRRPE